MSTRTLIWGESKRQLAVTLTLIYQLDANIAMVRIIIIMILCETFAVY